MGVFRRLDDLDCFRHDGHFLLAVIAQVPAACAVDGRNLYVCSLCNGGALGDVLNIYHDEIRT